MVLQNRILESDIVLSLEELNKAESYIQQGYSIAWCGNGKIVLRK